MRLWVDLILAFSLSLSISAMLKALSKRRENNLKIIIMSATIETEKFARFFDTQNIVYLQGRCHPIEVFYCRQPQPDYIVLNTMITYLLLKFL